MTAAQRALHYILTGYNDFCSLCFKTIVEKGEFHNTDEVLINNENIKLFEVLAYDIGDHCIDNTIFGAVCKECTTTAINSYKFIKMCQQNTHKFNSVIEAFHKHFKYSIHIDGLQSLSLALNGDYTINQYPVQQSKVNTEMKSNYNKQFSPRKAVNTCYFENNVEVESVVQTKKKAESKTKLQGCHDAFQICDKINDSNASLYKCKECLKVFPHPWNLKQHYVRVHAPKKFRCNQCSKSYGSEMILQLHVSQSHCAVVCSECGKTYQNTYSLKKHELGHKTRLTCQMCGKIYKGKFSFDKHINSKLCLQKRKSNSEAKFICNYCEKKYSQKTAISIHIQMEHENGRAHLCQWCSKKFASQSKLKEHVVKHTKEKNFGCDLCGGRYVTKASLLYHTRIHTGERPYKCIHCECSFLSASRCSDHLRRHHMAPSLECDICHRKFKDRSCFLKHKKRHYNPNIQLCSDGV